MIICNTVAENFDTGQRKATRGGWRAGLEGWLLAILGYFGNFWLLATLTCFWLLCAFVLLCFCAFVLLCFRRIKLLFKKVSRTRFFDKAGIGSW